MKNLFLSLFLILILATPSFSANVTIADLTNDATPTTDDLIETENDPGGTPGSRKVTIGNLLSTFNIDNINSATATRGNILVGDSSGFVATSQFQVDPATGNLTTAGTIEQTGATSTITASGGAILYGDVSDTLELGQDAAGHDLFLYGDTASANMQWDSSADDLLFNGVAEINESITVVTNDINSATQTTGRVFISSGNEFHSDDLDLASGADADSATTQSDSGLEIVAGRYTLLRGCGDNQILKWDETQDDWNCEADGGAGGGGATNLYLPVQSAKLTGAYVTHTPAGCSTTASVGSAAIDGSAGPWKLLIDDTTDEAAVWQFVLPDNYSSSPVLDIHFAMASGTSLEVEFEAAIQCYTPTTDTADIDSASFANCAVGTATTVSASAGEVYSQSITLTDDSCAAGDTAWIWISTDADDATNDDATGDREVVGVEFSYTGS